MFVFFILDTCCIHIEVYYQIKMDASFKQSEVYGTYTKSGSVNGYSSYQSDFNNGAFGIWRCGAFWVISRIKNIGTCVGNVATIADIDEKCVHYVGWDWKYHDWEDWAWKVAGEGLGVKCTGMHESALH